MFRGKNSNIDEVVQVDSVVASLKRAIIRLQALMVSNIDERMLGKTMAVKDITTHSCQVTE